jgi:hypothetical protein
MKRTYTRPKAVHVDFHYEEHVTATSAGGGHISGYGDPDWTGYCQQGDPAGCRIYWTASMTACKQSFTPYVNRP